MTRLLLIIAAMGLLCFWVGGPSLLALANVCFAVAGVAGVLLYVLGKSGGESVTEPLTTSANIVEKMHKVGQADSCDPVRVARAKLMSGAEWSDPDLEIDDYAIVLDADDGYWVSAWLWVSKDDCKDDDDVGDDMCDLCMTSEVNVARTTYCGKTIGIECGCEGAAEYMDGTCGDSDCDRCQAELRLQRETS